MYKQCSYHWGFYVNMTYCKSYEFNTLQKQMSACFDYVTARIMANRLQLKSLKMEGSTTTAFNKNRQDSQIHD